MMHTAKHTRATYYTYPIGLTLRQRDWLARAVRTGYALSQFAADAASFSFFLYLQFQSFTTALLFGISSGLISYTLTWGFKGRVIKTYLTGSEPVRINTKSKSHLSKNNAPVHLAIWTLTLLRALQEFGMNYFFIDSVLAWLNGLKHNTGIKLTTLSPQNLLVVAAYTLLVNIPFLISNEIYETAEEIHATFGLDNVKPSITCLLKPLALFRSFIVLTGPLYKSTEHLVNMLMLIPSTWLIYMYQCSTFFASMGFAGLIVSTSLLFSAHLVQSYFFEGSYSNKNLLSASGSLPQDDKPYRIQNDKQASFLEVMRQLLDTQAFFQAAEDARTILTTAEQIGLGSAAYLLGALQYLMVGVGIQCSDIYTAKKETLALLNDYYQTQAKARQQEPSICAEHQKPPKQ